MNYLGVSCSGEWDSRYELSWCELFSR